MQTGQYPEEKVERPAPGSPSPGCQTGGKVEASVEATFPYLHRLQSTLTGQQSRVLDQAAGSAPPPSGDLTLHPARKAFAGRVSKRKTLFLAFLLSFLPGCQSQQAPQSNASFLVFAPDEAKRPFSPFLKEMLVAEGFHSYSQTPRLSAEEMSQYDLILVYAGEIEESAVDLLEGYVRRGGHLLLFRPQRTLAERFGLKEKRVLEDGYWMDKGKAPVSNRPLQFKGRAQCWEAPPGGEVLATLSPRDEEDECPGIVLSSAGHGKIVAVAFDPVFSVVLLRQGDPTKANLEVDGVPGIRPHEMFQGGFWDPRMLYIPQADLLQRRMAGLIEDLSPAPLPRVWYFPGDARALLLMTGDAHEDPPEVIEYMLHDVESFGGTASIYLLPPVDKKWPVEKVLEWEDRGHDISVHPPHEGSVHERETRWESLSSAVTNFRETYGLPVLTIRNDWIIWYGWVEQARMQRKLGVEMDLNYLSSEPTHFGYMFGSGMPMHFIDSDGTIIDQYQQPTHFEDDVVVVPDIPWSLQYSTEEATAETTRLLADSLKGFYNVLCLNLHPDYYRHTRSGEWGRRTMEFARSRGIPIWSAKKWLQFVKARNAISFSNLDWSGNRLSLKILVPQPLEGSGLLLPETIGRRSLARVEIDGRDVEVQRGFPDLHRVMVALPQGSNFHLLVEYN